MIVPALLPSVRAPHRGVSAAASLLLAFALSLLLVCGATQSGRAQALDPVEIATARAWCSSRWKWPAPSSSGQQV